MQIGFDAKRAFTNNSGLGNYSRFVISSLIHHFPQNQYFLYTPKQHRLFRNFDPHLAHAQVVAPQGFWKKLSSAWRVLQVAAAVRHNKLDIFHGLSNELPSGIRRSGAKIVVTIHDLIFLRYPELYKPVDRAIYNYKFRNACKQAHGIVAISEQTKQDIIAYFGTEPSKIEVIYQDCNAIFHQKCDADSLNAVRVKYKLPERYLLCVGTLEPRKNQLTLLKAWHRAASDLEMVFVGRHTPYTNSLKAYIKQHYLEAKVHFMPYIQFYELPAIYQLATIFAYPSVFEGFGIPVVEALNSGIPVITSTGSCFREAGGKAARYVSPDNEAALTQAIQELSHNQLLRQQMIEAGYQHALKFRPAHTITQLHSLYERLLQY